MRGKIIFVLVVLILATTGLRASKVNAVHTDPSIQTFWAKFKLAVTKGDREAIASMTQFPVKMSYGVPSIKTKAALSRRYRDLFKVQSDAVKCFVDAVPRVDDRNPNQF